RKLAPSVEGRLGRAADAEPPAGVCVRGEQQMLARNRGVVDHDVASRLAADAQYGVAIARGGRELEAQGVALRRMIFVVSRRQAAAAHALLRQRRRDAPDTRLPNQPRVGIASLELIFEREPLAHQQREEIGPHHLRDLYPDRAPVETI